MTSATPCATSSCTNAVAERPRYYPRQLITADDLMLEQEYFRNKMRRHNRLLHGWGVVCGAKVCPAPAGGGGAGTSSFDSWKVVVTPGYVLGPYGDEIVLDCCLTVDLRTSGTSGMTGDPCVQPVDPWCSDVFVSREPAAPLYVAVKYQECKTRPIRVQPIGCGCDDNACEYSRFQDGYEIGILTSCPDANAAPPDISDVGKGGASVCPDCPTQPWVVLAKVLMDADGMITTIDNCECRRIVLSFGSFWWQCQSGKVVIKSITPADTNANTQAIPQGTTGFVLDVALQLQHASGKTPTVTADLGPGVTVTSFTLNKTADGAVLTIDVLRDAVLGPRTLTVTTDAGSEAAVENAITVVVGSPPAAAGALDATVALPGAAKN
ncbi:MULTISPECIES: hypothetical protein [unclassified Burkholderia]|uniref:hypothetical protein n=1 Tax=unclassified Burkholderia TaxID=2613784 RepID=UPI00196679A6|nr:MULTISPECIES: hypothetical protein [unclassified Burkholderia]